MPVCCLLYSSLTDLVFSQTPVFAQKKKAKKKKNKKDSRVPETNIHEGGGGWGEFPGDIPCIAGNSSNGTFKTDRSKAVLVMWFILIVYVRPLSDCL